MQTTMKKIALAASLLTVADAALAQSAPAQVPAITEAITQPMPAQPEPPATVVLPPPVPVEPVSASVKRARTNYDTTQRAQIAEYIANARQAPTSAATSHVGAQTVYPYRPGGIFTIYTGVGRITDVALQPGEELTGQVQGGDTVRWLVDQVTSGSDEGNRIHIIIKPMETDLATDIFIPTNRRTYMLNVRSVTSWHMPSVAWTYPADAWKRQQVVAAKQESVVPVAASPENMRFDYSIASSSRTRAWTPLQVFDDGQQTYIRMPANLNATDAPALFIIEDGKPLMVNYRVRGVADGSNGPTYVVDRLFDRAELRVGAKNRVTIRRR